MYSHAHEEWSRDEGDRKRIGSSEHSHQRHLDTLANKSNIAAAKGESRECEAA
jgi:hypothetical protein